MSQLCRMAAGGSRERPSALIRPHAPDVIHTDMLAIPESISNGGRIALLPVQPAHAKGVFEAAVESRAQLENWMEWCHADYSLRDSEQYTDSCRKAWEADAEFG